MDKKVSLITTLYNEENNIFDFLASYRDQTRHADEFIIVDGGSTDKTPQIIENFISKYPELNIRIVIDLTCSRKYIAGAIAQGRNIAISNAQHEIIAVTDAGCLLHKNWLKEIVKPFENNSVDVVAGWYEPVINNKFQKIYAEIYLPRLGEINKKDFLPSSRSIAFKKKCWEKVGGYPVATYTAEDTKFDIDLKKAGFEFAFNEKAIVSWEVPFDFEEAKRKHFNYNFGDGQYRLNLKSRIRTMIGLFIPIRFIFDEKFKVRKHLKTRYILAIYSTAGYFSGFVKGIKN